MPHPNNKRQKTHPIVSRPDYHLTQPCPSEETQKNSAQISPCAKLTDHCTNLKRAETKRKKEFSFEAWERETSNTISLKKNNEKAEKHYTNEGTTRNMEVKKKNEGEIGRLLEEG